MNGAGILNITKENTRLYPLEQKIKANIDEFRKDACQYYDTHYKKDKQSIAKHSRPNHTISILGDRGAGKTSLMLTVLNKLEWDGEKKRTENIVLPIIDPEKFNAEKDALGWVIFLFQDYLNSLEEKNKDFCTESLKQLKEIKEQYQNLKKTYIHSRENARSEMSGFVSGNSEYSRVSEKVIFADMNLAKELDCFIHELVCFLNKKNKSKEECKEYKNGCKGKDEYKNQTLIFIAFDDIDLCHEQGSKILTTILEYLSHPAIVTLVLGKLDNFMNGIEDSILRKRKIYDLKEERDENKKTAGETALELLKKGMPPIYRYYLKQFTFNQLMAFRPYENKKEYSKNIKELLENITLDDKRIINLYEYFDFEKILKKSELNEIIKEKLKKYREIEKSPYENILPKLPRDAMNFYSALQKAGEKGNTKYDIFMILYEYYYNYLENNKITVNYLDDIFTISDINYNYSNDNEKEIVNIKPFKLNINQNNFTVYTEGAKNKSYEKILEEEKIIFSLLFPRIVYNNKFKDTTDIFNEKNLIDFLKENSKIIENLDFQKYIEYISNEFEKKLSFSLDKVKYNEIKKFLKNLKEKESIDEFDSLIDEIKNIVRKIIDIRQFYFENPERKKRYDFTIPPFDSIHFASIVFFLIDLGKSIQESEINLNLEYDSSLDLYYTMSVYLDLETVIPNKYNFTDLCLVLKFLSHATGENTLKKLQEFLDNKGI